MGQLRTYSDVDVLDDDVACSPPKSQPLTPDDTLGAYTNNRLVARNIDGLAWSVVVRASLPRPVVACVPDPSWPLEVPLGHLVVALSLQHWPLVVPSLSRKSKNGLA